MPRKKASQESKALKQTREGKLDPGPRGKAALKQALVTTNTGHGVKGDSSADAVVQAERLYAIFEYRKMGANLTQIGQKFDLSVGRVHAIITEAIARLPKQGIEDVRSLELERCDAMQMSLWPAAIKGDIGAITTILAIMNRRARYLGLDVVEAAPTDPNEKASNEAEARKALLAKLTLAKKRMDEAAAEAAKS
jgi:hypothetical protein